MHRKCLAIKIICAINKVYDDDFKKLYRGVPAVGVFPSPGNLLSIF